MMKRRTKIVATLGPATDDVSTLENIISSGLDVARINCSHGTNEERIIRAEKVRSAAKKIKYLCGDNVRSSRTKN